MTSFTAQNLGASKFDRIRRGSLQAALIMVILCALSMAIGLLMTIDNAYFHIFLSADKITPETIRYGNTFLYVDYATYLMLGGIFLMRNCDQGIGRASYALIAGAAELVARIVVSTYLPAAIVGGAVSASGKPACVLRSVRGGPGGMAGGGYCARHSVRQEHSPAGLPLPLRRAPPS